MRVCDATFGKHLPLRGRCYSPRSNTQYSGGVRRGTQAIADSPAHSSISARLLATKTAVQVVDLAADEDYVERRHRSIAAAVELGGTRTVLAVPMLKERELVGVLI